MEQHGEFSPVCIYMRDEVSQQSRLDCLFSFCTPKIRKSQLCFPTWKVFLLNFLERGSRKMLVFSKHDVSVRKKAFLERNPGPFRPLSP